MEYGFLTFEVTYVPTMYACVQPSCSVPVHTSAYAQRVTAINIYFHGTSRAKTKLEMSASDNHLYMYLFENRKLENEVDFPHARKRRKAQAWE